MKIALITDTHAGGRNDSLIFDSYFKKFYDEIFFPYLKENEIKTVIHLGDVFCRRKYINFNILRSCKEYFFNPLRDNGITTHIIAGNHDEPFKNLGSINSPNLLLQEYENITTYHSPVDIEIDGLSIALVPWIQAENYKESLEFINNTKSQIMMGHLELAGFEMHKGSIAERGTIDVKLLDRFDTVMSGHFHHKSRSRNIHYLGAPYEMSWSDYDDIRGFHIFDTETRELTHIQNPFYIFHKIYYDDSDKDLDTLLDIADYSNCYVKLIVQEKTNPYWFDIYLDKLEKQGLANLQTIESAIGMDFEDDDFMDQCEDTLSLLKKYCEQIEVSADKSKLSQFLERLYTEALDLECS